MLDQYRKNQAMLSHSSPLSISSQSIGRPYSVGGCPVVLAMASIIIAIEISFAAALSGAAAPSVEIVNRKGDRLPLFFVSHAINQPLQINRPRIPGPEQELADGCESLASSLAYSPLANIAGRCVS